MLNLDTVLETSVSNPPVSIVLPFIISGLPNNSIFYTVPQNRKFTGQLFGSGSATSNVPVNINNTTMQLSGITDAQVVFSSGTVFRTTNSSAFIIGIEEDA